MVRAPQRPRRPTARSRQALPALMLRHHDQDITGIRGRHHANRGVWVRLPPPRDHPGIGREVLRAAGTEPRPVDRMTAGVRALARLAAGAVASLDRPERPNTPAGLSE